MLATVYQQQLSQGTFTTSSYPLPSGVVDVVFAASLASADISNPANQMLFWPQILKGGAWSDCKGKAWGGGPNASAPTLKFTGEAERIRLVDDLKIPVSIGWDISVSPTKGF